MRSSKAFEWLEKGPFVLLPNGERFERLRADPRYKDLLKRMGLPG